MTSISYDALKAAVPTYVDNDNKHLFKVGDVQFALFSKPGRAWRILTTLDKNQAEGLVTFLNDQYVNVFSAGERAWHDLKRPKFRLPIMNSQIDARYLTIDMIQGIIAAIQQFVGMSNVRVIRRGGSGQQPVQPQKVIKTISLPKSKSKKSIIKRLKRKH